MLSVKQSSIKYHFLSLWYDSTWDWTQVFRAIGEHSNHYANAPYHVILEEKEKNTFPGTLDQFFWSKSISNNNNNSQNQLFMLMIHSHLSL